MANGVGSARAFLGTNGSRPLADTALGSAGEVTGTERAKIQNVGSVVEATLGSNFALSNSMSQILSISLSAGTWLIWAEAELSVTSPGYRVTMLIQNTTGAQNLIAGSDTMAAPSRHFNLGPITTVLGSTSTITFRGGVETLGAATVLANESYFGIAPTTKITAVRIA